jgi:hypothetical protein
MSEAKEVGAEQQKADSGEIRDVIAIAEFVEKLIQSEQQWIMNRLQWLFTSQSFLLTAYGVLVTRPGNPRYENVAELLITLLPWVGLCFCALVGVAIFAAEGVLSPVGDTRQSLTIVINSHPKMPRNEAKDKIIIPKVGTHGRDHPWTRIVGSLPHRVLPWTLAGLWLALGSHPTWLLAWFGIAR